MSLSNLQHRLEYLIFRSLICVIQALSFRQTVWISEQLAWVMTNMLPRKMSRYKVAAENLRLAYGDEMTAAEIHMTIYGMWTHLFRMVCEIAQSPRKLRLENCRESIIFKDRRRIMQAMSTGRPVIVLGGHFGNWEVSMSTFGIFGYRMGVVARALDNPYIHQWFLDYRELTGHQMVLKKGGYDEIVEIMDRKGFLGMLCDQDAGSRGLFVDFFGKPASTFKSIALLAMEYNAIMSMGYGRRLPDDFINSHWCKFEVGCEEIIDPLMITAKDEVREITVRFTNALETIVRRNPEQYFWIHRRWKSVPRTRSKSTGLADAA
jgi:KDO2-lipid IV(A) lauroyltransferase